MKDRGLDHRAHDTIHPPMLDKGGAGAIMSFDLDAELFHRVYGWFHPSPLLPVMAWLTHLGEIKVVFFLTTGGLLVRFFRRKPSLAPWLGVPAAALVVAWMKEAVARPRPSRILEDYAFPSGHAALICAWAMLFCLWWPKGRVVWWSIAGLVVLSRVALGLHWPSDVVAGAAIGILSVVTVARLEKSLTRRC